MVFHQSVLQIPSAAHAPLSRSGTPTHTAFHRLSTSGATTHFPWSIGGYYQKRSTLDKKGKREVS